MSSVWSSVNGPMNTHPQLVSTGPPVTCFCQPRASGTWANTQPSDLPGNLSWCWSGFKALGIFLGPTAYLVKNWEGEQDPHSAATLEGHQFSWWWVVCTGCTKLGRLVLVLLPPGTTSKSCQGKQPGSLQWLLLHGILANSTFVCHIYLVMCKWPGLHFMRRVGRGDAFPHFLPEASNYFLHSAPPLAC